jgi:hypothetical protein
MSNVAELPVGQYDAVRTLRHALAQAERGDFTDCVVIVNNRHGTDDDRVWAVWSDMDAQHVWWLCSWFVSFLRRRYFSGQGLVT